jgi:hypothetical protein
MPRHLWELLASHRYLRIGAAADTTENANKVAGLKRESSAIETSRVLQHNLPDSRHRRRPSACLKSAMKRHEWHRQPYLSLSVSSHAQIRRDIGACTNLVTTPFKVLTEGFAGPQMSCKKTSAIVM